MLIIYSLRTKLTQRHTVTYVRLELCKHTLQLYDYNRFTPTLEAQLHMCLSDCVYICTQRV